MGKLTTIYRSQCDSYRVDYCSRHTAIDNTRPLSFVSVCGRDSFAEGGNTAAGYVSVPSTTSSLTHLSSHQQIGSFTSIQPYTT